MAPVASAAWKKRLIPLTLALTLALTLTLTLFLTLTLTLTLTWKKGLIPLTAICGQPKPRMPSKCAATKATPGSRLASAKSRLGTETEPRVTVSCSGVG